MTIPSYSFSDYFHFCSVSFLALHYRVQVPFVTYMPFVALFCFFCILFLFRISHTLTISGKMSVWILSIPELPHCDPHCSVPALLQSQASHKLLPVPSSCRNAFHPPAVKDYFAEFPAAWFFQQIYRKYVPANLRIRWNPTSPIPLRFLPHS